MKLPVNKTDVRTFSIASSTNHFTTEGLWGEYLPHKIVVGFVDSDTFLGNIRKNPFEFKKLDLQSIEVLCEGDRNSSYSLDVDYDANMFLQSYNSLFHFTKYGEDGNGLTRLEYNEDGYALYGFDLLCSSNSDALFPLQPGKTRFLVKFKTPVSNACTMIIMGVFSNLIEVNANRDVKVLF